MVLEIITAVLAGLMGVFTLTPGLKKWFFKIKKDKTITITIKMENGSKYEIPSNLPKEDFKKLIIKLRSLENTDVKKAQKNNEAGFVSNDFLVYIVPAIIAILFALTFLYLIIANQGKPDYNVPKELSSAMTTIIGYFFGIGVANATNKGKPLSKYEINELINKQR